MLQKLNTFARCCFLVIFVFSLFPMEAALAASFNASFPDAPLSTGTMLKPKSAAMALIRGPIDVSAETAHPSTDIILSDQNGEPDTAANLTGGNFYTNPAFPQNSFSGGLTIEPITAYNLIVDSNVLSPSSYGPSAATLGAQFCNTSGAPMTNVWAYAGDYNADNDNTPGEAGDLTPGTYPIHNASTDATFNATFPHLATPPTAVDYGDPTRFYALEQESGSSVESVDASRYIGTLAAGECRTEYWLVSYPRKALIGGNWVDVTGGVKPEDDLWLSYFFWATSGVTSSNRSYIWRPVTMRNEISAMANKIWPNGDNKVPDQYVQAIQQVLGWDTWTPNGSGTTAYPGETVVSQGIWYDLGNVGAGFDNNGDFVPDRNVWVQPIGDSGAYDPGCFRLVRTYGLVIVKLNDGTELLIPFVDRMYFEGIPDNNNGAVGLVYYEYIALDGACTAGLTPYQEVASGYDNEKFNADFGAGIPPLQSRQTNMTFDKNGETSVGLGGTIHYTMTFTLPDADTTSGNTMTVTVGNPALDMPLTYYETVPSGLQYVGGSASANVTMTNYSVGTIPATRLWSTDSGATWSANDPGPVTSVAPNNLVLIQWQLDQGITSPATNPAVTGQVSFSANVPGTYTATVVNNTSCLKLGSADCFVEDTHTTLVTGTGRIEGTVWRDDATGGGVLGNGVMDETGAGINAVTVNLYWDANGDGDHTDASDFRYAATTSNASGDYAFTNLPATSGSARYLIEVNASDSDIPSGYGPSTVTAYIGITLAGGAIYGDGANEPSDFGFAPALSLDKQLNTVGTIYTGDSINYTIYLKNNLPGDGSPGGGFCTYTVWAKNYVADTSDTPGGSSSGNGRWQSPTNLLNAQDGGYAFTVMNDNSDYVGLSGFNNISMGNLGGSITAVNYVAYVRERADLKGTDALQVLTYYNNAPLVTHSYFGDGTFSGGATNGYFTGGIASTYTVTADLTGLRAWTFADFRNNLTEMQLVGNKGGGGGASGDIEVDAAAFVVTTNQLCNSSASSILNPVPLTDTFDNTRFSFISADPAPTGVAGGTITWTNVGPIYPGGERVVRVTLRATATGTNVPNTGTSINSRFENGIPANTPVTDTVSVNILAGTNGQISGVIWDDDDSDGWQGATGYEVTDTRISDVRVTLYACQDLGGALLTGNPSNQSCGSRGGSWLAVATTYTSATGTYSFGGLRQGYYRVVVDPSTIVGYTRQTGDPQYLTGLCSSAVPSLCDNQYRTDVDNVGDTLVITGSNSITTVNFGYVAPDGATSTIGDTLFYDWDGNALQDAIDEGIGNITVRLYDLSGDMVGTAVTDQSGHYLFSNLPVGQYTVRIDLADTDFPASVSQTADPDQNGTCTSCDSVGTGSVDGTNSDLTVDFGYQPTGSGTIGDTVWKDINGDGLQSSSEPGISGVTISLQVDRNGDGTYVTIASDVTDAGGKYLFADLPQGTYRVALNLTANTAAIPNDAFGNDYLPSTGTTVGSLVYQTRTLPASTSSDLTADFGFAPPASIGDTVYYDLNGNGTQDFTEAGINGVTVTLYTFTDANANRRYDPGETLSAPVASATTATVNGKTGFYQFTGLTPGNYVVQVTPPAGMTLTGDPNTDGFACPDLHDPADPGEPSSLVCDSRDGMRLYNGTNYTGADFGYQPLGVIGDTLWVDTDADGVRDLSEQGIANITVNLCADAACTTVVQTTTADLDGYYSFGSVPNGTYYVRVDTADADFPAGLTVTYNAPHDSVVDDVTRVLVSGNVVTEVGDATPACTNCSLTVDFGYRYVGARDLSGTICLENASANGVCGTTGSGIGADESAYASVVVYLYLWNDDGDALVGANEVMQIASVQTNASGDYSFENIPDGVYYVIALGAPQNEIQLTTTQASVGAPTTQVVETTNSNGDTVSASQVVQVNGSDVQNRDFAFETGPLDYGDLPSTYSTRINDSPMGPSHTVPTTPSLYLGPTAPDSETNGSPTADASGDGADEDGVSLVGVWGNGVYNPVNGTGGAVSVTVNGSGYLIGWIDFNRDGDFTDTGEMIIHQAASAGTTSYTFDIPAETFAGPSDPADMTLYARFRLFESQPLFPSLAYSGAAGNGEVEDYAFYWSMTVDKDTNTPTAGLTGTVTYTVVLRNTGNATLTNVQAVDNFDSVFGTGLYTVNSVTAPGLTVNSSYNGSTNTSLLAGTDSMAPGDSRTITITLTLNNPSAGTYENTVSAASTQTGTIDDDGAVAQDSNTPSGSDPETDEDVTVSVNGSITIIEDSVPDEAQDFAYTVNPIPPLSPFTLDDDAEGTLPNTQVFTGLAPGTYAVAETPAAGWLLTNIVCSGATLSVVNIGTDADFDAGDTNVSVNLAAGENVTCTFTNTKIQSPSISKAFAPDRIGPNNASTLTFTLTNPNAGVGLIGVAFSDTYPGGLVNTTPVTVNNTCNGSLTADNGAGSVSLTGGTILPGGSCTITITVTSAAAGTYNNTTGNVSSTNGGTGNMANARLNVISAMKSIVATSEDASSGTDVMIGEIVRYRLVVDLPEGTTTNLQILDRIVAVNMAYMNDGMTRVAFVCNSGAACASSSNGSIGTGPVISGNTASVTPMFVLPASAITNNDGGATSNPFPAGNDPRFSLGSVTNNDNDGDAEYVVIEFNALVRNTIANIDGATRGNDFTVLVNGSTLLTSNNSTVTILEPALTISKAITTAPTDAGDTIVYELTVTNAGNAPAFDIVVSDALNAVLTGPVVVSGTTTGGACGSTASLISGSFTSPTASATITCLNPGGVATISISAHVMNNAASGLTFANSASLTYTSLPGAGAPASNPTGSATPGGSGTSTGERDGSGSLAPDDYTALSNIVSTTLATPLIDKLNPVATATIGETITYNICVALPEGQTQGLVVTDDIPAGLAVQSYSISGAANGVCPGATAAYSGNAGSVAVTSLPAAFPGADGADLSLSFGTITTDGDNVDGNNTFLIQVTAQVLNVAGNQEGNTRSNTASLTYTDPNDASTDSATDPTAPSATTIVEPTLNVTKAASTLTPAPGTLTFTLTIAHTAASDVPAYDTWITDSLPAGLSGLTNVNVSSVSSCATGIADSSTGSVLNVTIGMIPLSCTVTITYDVTVSGLDGDTRTNSVDMTWTSLSGAVAGERTGADGPGGALNDYADTAAVTVTVNVLNNAVISDYVWNDADGDGIQDGTETGMGAGIRIYLDLDHDNSYDAGEPTDLTDASGLYAINGLGAGSYDVRVDNPPAGYVQSYDLDGTGTSNEASVTVTAGEVRTDVDFGYLQLATIGDLVWYDDDVDGVQDVGEAGIAGINVYVDVDGSGTFNAGDLSDVTDGSGIYSIANIPPGTYNVRVNNPPAGATLTGGSDPANTSLTAGETDSTIDFGYYRSGTVDGHLYYDANGTGTQDAGEANLSNVSVLITPAIGAPFTVTTNAAGNWTATVPPGPTIADVDTTDADFTSVVPTGWNQTEGTDPTTVAAIAGASMSAGNDGFYTPGTVSGHLYIDTNGNSTQDAGEPNLVNVDVVITPFSGAPSTVTSDANGNWTATVPPGSTSANVDETDPQYPAGYTQTEGTDPTTVTAVAGSPVSAGNDGYYLPPATATLTLQKTLVNNNGGTASDTAWILTAAGPSTISGTEGQAAITGAVVQAGTYTLSESGGPSGYTAGTWSCVAALDSDPNDGLALAAGETVTCTITNNDDAPGLTLNKIVVNDNGGTAAENDWTLTATGPTTLSGAGAPGGADVMSGAGFSAGTYTLSESGPAGYTATAWTCTNGVTVTANQITLDLGETTVCSITNDDTDIPPQADPDTNTALENGPVVGGNVMTNETSLGNEPTTVTAAVDDDGDPLVIGVAFTTDNGGSLTLNANGTYSYTPPAWNLVPPAGVVEVFNYTITDVDGDPSSTTLTITVNDNNRVPIANDDSFMTTVNTPVSHDLKPNHGSGADVPSGDGGNIWTKLTDPSHGTVTVNTDGTFIYTPNAGYYGLDTFTYRICDVDNDCDPATVTIDIRGNPSNLTKMVDSTSEVTTAGSNVAIGEIVTYRVNVIIPSGTFNNVRLVDVMTPGLAFVGCDSITSAPGTLTSSLGSLAAICADPALVANGTIDPLEPNSDLDRQVTFDFGTLTNNTGSDQTLTIVYRTVVLDIRANTSGASLHNNASWYWDASGKIDAVPPTISVAEPKLGIEKTADITFVMVGSETTFTITIAHLPASTADAFDILVEDILPAELDYVPGSLDCTPGAQDPNPMDCSYNPVARTIQARWGQFTRAGGNGQIRFRARTLSIPSSGNLTNTARVEWSSLPGVVAPQSHLPDQNPFSTERFYDPADPVGINGYSVASSLLLTPLGAPGTDKDFNMPLTGFAPNEFTFPKGLPVIYSSTGTTTLEIAALGLKVRLAGVPLQHGEWNLQWLWSQAGWLEGTAFPGLEGNSVITAHVVSPFGSDGPFAKLHTLRIGEYVAVTANGNRYTYKVVSNQRVEPDDISILRHEDTAWLTLLTCDNYDESTKTYLKRVVVRAVLVDVGPAK